MEVLNHQKSAEKLVCCTHPWNNRWTIVSSMDCWWDPSCPGMCFKLSMIGHPRWTPMKEHWPCYGPSLGIVAYLPTDSTQLVRMNISSFKFLQFSLLDITPHNLFSLHFLPFLPTSSLLTLIPFSASDFPRFPRIPSVPFSPKFS